MARFEVTESLSLYSPFELLCYLALHFTVAPTESLLYSVHTTIPPLNYYGANVPWCRYINQNVLFQRSVTKWLLQEDFEQPVSGTDTKAPAFLRPLRTGPCLRPQFRDLHTPKQKGGQGTHLVAKTNLNLFIALIPPVGSV